MNNPWRAMALVGALGFEVALFTIIGLFLGRWLSGAVPGWTLFGVLGGLAVGILVAIVAVMKVVDSNSE